MIAIALGLSTAILWGVADFAAGVQARRLPLLFVSAVSQAPGFLVIVVLVLVVWPPMPSVGQFGLGALGGASVAVGVVCYYGSLARGSMSVVAPIAASGVAIPVLYGLVAGERPGPVVLAGVVITFVGILFAVQAKGGAPVINQRQSIVFAVIAAIGFGAFFVLVDQLVEESILWVILAVRVASAVIITTAAVVTRATPGAAPVPFGTLIAIGLADLGGQLCYFLAASEGMITLVAVLASLHTVVTIILARAVLEERVSPIQATGIGLVLVGVLMLASG
ncbi:MAG: hypothetical protein QOE75_2014 [Solirubrobacterales bacterium]|jgi:drug/metabolite transporter (DMT)-like permease|nr:hypothetical protein [Solirubrobacterales bacterium]